VNPSFCLECLSPKRWRYEDIAKSKMEVKVRNESKTR